MSKRKNQSQERVEQQTVRGKCALIILFLQFLDSVLVICLVLDQCDGIDHCILISHLFLCFY